MPRAAPAGPNDARVVHPVDTHTGFVACASPSTLHAPHRSCPAPRHAPVVGSMCFGPYHAMAPHAHVGALVAHLVVLARCRFFGGCVSPSFSSGPRSFGGASSSVRSLLQRLSQPVPVVQSSRRTIVSGNGAGTVAHSSCCRFGRRRNRRTSAAPSAGLVGNIMFLRGWKRTRQSRTISHYRATREPRNGTSAVQGRCVLVCGVSCLGQWSVSRGGHWPGPSRTRIKKSVPTCGTKHRGGERCVTHDPLWHSVPRRARICLCVRTRLAVSESAAPPATWQRARMRPGAPSLSPKDDTSCPGWRNHARRH